MKTIEEALGRAPATYLQYRDAGASVGRKPEYLAEIMIQSYESPRLPGADRKQHVVLGTLKLLFPDRHDIMAGRPQ